MKFKKKLVNKRGVWYNDNCTKHEKLLWKIDKFEDL